jgi:hypothetical protein
VAMMKNLKYSLSNTGVSTTFVLSEEAHVYLNHKVFKRPYGNHIFACLNYERNGRRMRVSLSRSQNTAHRKVAFHPNAPSGNTSWGPEDHPGLPTFGRLAFKKIPDLWKAAATKAGPGGLDSIEFYVDLPEKLPPPRPRRLPVPGTNPAVVVDQEPRTPPAPTPAPVEDPLAEHLWNALRATNPSNKKLAQLLSLAMEG